MSQVVSGVSDGQAARRTPRALKVARGLAFTASPTFLTLALLTIARGDNPAEMLCSAAHPSPLSGMATMYLLMCVFHAAPWLNLIGERLPLVPGVGS